MISQKLRTTAFTAAATILLVPQAWSELLFVEDFDFPSGIEILGNENGWQADFNDEGPSVVKLAPRHTQEASPFEPVGMAIQPGNSKETSHRKVEDYNGKRLFFSYSTKIFRTEGTSVLRFRTEVGNPVPVGHMDGRFGVKLQDHESSGRDLEEKTSYFIAGMIETSDDGKEVQIMANIYTLSGDVPMDEPTSWEVMAEYLYGMPKLWNGVEFSVASSSAAFDGLRLGTSWEAVTQP